MKRFFAGFFILLILLTENCFARVSVIGGLSRKKTVVPGEKVEGVILLQNNAETSYQVKVYQTDYVFFADGKTLYGNVGSIKRSNASWITISPNLLNIPPKNNASVYYTIKVPKDPDLKGTYWSIIMIEPVEEEKSKEDDKAGEKEAKLGIKTIMRYGIQVINEIGETGKVSIRFLDKKVIMKDEKRIFQLDIENDGERWLSPFVWVELYNEKGANVGKFESDNRRIFPGCSIRHGIDLTNVPKGKYKASVIIDNKDENVFGAQYDLQLE